MAASCIKPTSKATLQCPVTAEVTPLDFADRDALDQPLPLAAAANEAYKEAKAKGLGDDDFAAVYEAVQAPAPQQ